MFLRKLACTLLLAAIVGCSNSSSSPSSEQNTTPNSDILADTVQGDQNNPFATVSFDDADGEDGTGDEATESREYLGEVGIIFDARNIARKGYKPSKIEFTATGNNIVLNEEVELGSHSFMGGYKREVADILDTEGEGLEAVNELLDGLDIEVTVKDANDDTILSGLLFSRVVFDPNAKPVSINENTLPEIEQPYTFNEKVDFFIQLVDRDGNAVDRGMSWNGENGKKVMTLKNGIPLGAPDTYAAQDFLFNFFAIPGEENTFAIKHKGTDRFLAIKTVNTKSDLGTRQYYYKGLGWLNHAHHRGLTTRDISTLEDVLKNSDKEAYKFKIIKDGNGIVKIASKKYNGSLFMIGALGLSLQSGALIRNAFGFSDFWQNNDATRWRIVTTAIDWEAESIASESVQTVIPAPRTGVAFETTETNCGSKELVTTTGVERSAQTTVSAEWAESMTLTSSQSNTLGWSVTAGFSAGDVGPNFSATLSGSHTWTTENSETYSEVNANETTETISYAAQQKITVPSLHKVKYTAEYEIYDNIESRFVQRIHIRGRDRLSGEYLTGEQIETQLEFSSYDGVITDVGGDVVEMTLQGSVNVNNLIRGNTLVTEESYDCSSLEPLADWSATID